MKRRLLVTALIFIFLQVLSPHGFPAPDPTVIESSTTTTKSSWHVVFQEVIKSKLQKDWTDVYNARVEVFHNGASVGTFRGSTLPNSKPKTTMPSDYIYSVVSATCSLPKRNGQQLYYTWTRGKRADTTNPRPCLRLAKNVPTVNVGSSRILDKFISYLQTGSVSGNFQYAEDILVHSGWIETARGSAGCLTIHPDDQERFFALMSEGTKGTLELNRGIEDESTQSSYCY